MNFREISSRIAMNGEIKKKEGNHGEKPHLSRPFFIA